MRILVHHTASAGRGDVRSPFVEELTAGATNRVEGERTNKRRLPSFSHSSTGAGPRIRCRVSNACVMRRYAIAARGYTLFPIQEAASVSLIFFPQEKRKRRPSASAQFIWRSTMILDDARLARADRRPPRFWRLCSSSSRLNTER